MNILCVGGAGQIGREAVIDLLEHSDFEKIVIGDVEEKNALKLIKQLGDKRLDFTTVDITDPEKSASIFRNFDVVFGSLPIKYDDLFVSAVVKAGVSGLDITGMGKTYFQYDGEAKNKDIIFVPGVGMTPGTTNVLARYICDQMDEVNEIYISHGAFRAIALSPGLSSTTFIEYDPDIPDRVIYENGKYIKVPPFHGEKLIELPEPFGVLPQYIIPHPECFTLPRYIKGVKRIEVRGTWPSKNMHFVRALYDYGFLRNEKIKIEGIEIGALDFIMSYLSKVPEGKESDIWGYSLHVEVTGKRNGRKAKHIVTTASPSGNLPGWEGARAYTRSVGIPLSIGAQLISKGRIKEKGIVAPEGAFDPVEFIGELRKRGIRIFEKIEEEDEIS